MMSKVKIVNDQEKYLIDISDSDILKAMKDIGGYLDITFSDFKELYHVACSHAFKRLMHSVKASDIMTKGVISVNQQTSSKEIAEIMAKHSVSGVPVIDDQDQVVGIISESIPSN